MTAGYSGTPLAQMLELKPGIRCWFHNLPDEVRAAIDPEALGVEEQATASAGLQCALLFTTDSAKLGQELAALRPLMAGNGFIWACWPEPTKTETGLGEDKVRDLAQPLGLVDVKVCAIDATWSGLKLVLRKEDR